MGCRWGIFVEQSFSAEQAVDDSWQTVVGSGRPSAPGEDPSQGRG